TVYFELTFAWAAEEAETATLALQVGPALHEAATLISQMGQFDLEPAFLRRRAPTKDFEDQPGAVEHLGVPRLLQVTLLHGRQRAVADDDAGLKRLHEAGDLIDLAGPDVSCRANFVERNDASFDHIEVDGSRQPDRLLQPRLRRTLVERPRCVAASLHAP